MVIAYAIKFLLNGSRTVKDIGDLRWEYEYKIEYEYDFQFFKSFTPSELLLLPVFLPDVKETLETRSVGQAVISVLVVKPKGP